MNSSQNEDSLEVEILDSETLEQDLIQFRTKMYNEESHSFLMKLLTQMGFAFIEHKLKEQWIDYQAFQNLKTSHIMKLFSEYPIGVAIKFEEAYDAWKASIIESTKETVSGGQIKIYHGIVAYIFNETKEGRQAVSQLDIERKLDKDGEALVCQVVSSHFLSKKILLEMQDISLLADEIEAAFPNEKSSSYFDKINKGGPLYDKYHNSLRSLRNAKLMPCTSRKRKAKEDNVSKSTEFYSEEEIQSNDFVKSSCSNSDLGIFVNHWIRSSKIRIDTLRRASDLTFSSTYKALKRADGYILVNHDFEYLFPKRNFQNVWNTYQQELVNILKRDVKQDSVKHSLERIETMSQNQSLAAILVGLNYHLQGAKLSYGETKKNVYKPTVYDCFSSMLLIVSQESNLDIELKQWMKVVTEKNLNQQAIIIGFGASIDNLSDKYCVFVEDVRYIFEGENALLRALESTLKIYHVYNLEFPLLSKSVYEFLSVKFLSIGCKKKYSTKVTRLLNSFTD